MLQLTMPVDTAHPGPAQVTGPAPSVISELVQLVEVERGRPYVVAKIQCAVRRMELEGVPRAAIVAQVDASPSAVDKYRKRTASELESRLGKDPALFRPNGRSLICNVETGARCELLAAQRERRVRECMLQAYTGNEKAAKLLASVPQDAPPTYRIRSRRRGDAIDLVLFELLAYRRLYRHSPDQPELLSEAELTQIYGGRSRGLLADVADGQLNRRLSKRRSHVRKYFPGCVSDGGELDPGVWAWIVQRLTAQPRLSAHELASRLPAELPALFPAYQAPAPYNTTAVAGYIRYKYTEMRKQRPELPELSRGTPQQLHPLRYKPELTATAVRLYARTGSKKTALRFLKRKGMEVSRLVFEQEGRKVLPDLYIVGVKMELRNLAIARHVDNVTPHGRPRPSKRQLLALMLPTPLGGHQLSARDAARFAEETWGTVLTATRLDVVYRGEHELDPARYPSRAWVRRRTAGEGRSPAWSHREDIARLWACSPGGTAIAQRWLKREHNIPECGEISPPTILSIAKDFWGEAFPTLKRALHSLRVQLAGLAPLDLYRIQADDSTAATLLADQHGISEDAVNSIRERRHVPGHALCQDCQVAFPVDVDGATNLRCPGCQAKEDARVAEHLPTRFVIERQQQLSVENVALLHGITTRSVLTIWAGAPTMRCVECFGYTREIQPCLDCRSQVRQRPNRHNRQSLVLAISEFHAAGVDPSINLLEEVTGWKDRQKIRSLRDEEWAVSIAELVKVAPITGWERLRIVPSAETQHLVDTLNAVGEKLRSGLK